MNFLKAEFERRKTKNPAYSIRAFARDLELSPGHLSHLITGKRKLSYPIALALLEKFGYSEKERAKALRKIKSESLGEDFKRKLSQPSKEKIYKDLNVLKIAADKYLQVCHWHHDAVFHLLRGLAKINLTVFRISFLCWSIFSGTVD